MKNLKNSLTLENIGKLIDRKLVPVFGELDGIKQQIVGLDSKIEIHRKETREGFDNVYDGLETLGKTIDHNLEPRIKRLENSPLAKRSGVFV